MLRSLLSNFISGKKTVLFAITNSCNCRCEMCSIWKQKNKRMVTLEEARMALRKLRKNNFGGFLQITGGEPLLNPDIFSIIDYAKKLGFSVFLVTNGTLINRSVARKLWECGVDNVGVSFHHHDEFLFEKISNHKRILYKVVKAVEYLKEENILVEGLFTITKYNKDDVERTVRFINSLGIDVSFCTPVIVKDTSYSLGGNCVEFSNEELKDIILEIIRLKKKRYRIINNITFFEEVLRFLNGKEKYYCLGGYKIFYLDWNLNFYPCMFKGKPIPIDEMDFNFRKVPCNDCIFQCFREPSLFLVSKPMTLKLILLDLFTYLRLIRHV